MLISLKDKIVIIDEAHNTEDACRESTSPTFSKFQIETGLIELRKLVQFGLHEAEVIDAVNYFIILVNTFSF